jgi:stearoyl-CoA desaturase (delta-9 desaturase)
VTATEIRPDPRPAGPTTRPLDERVNKRSSIPFVALHFIPLLVIWTGISRTAVLLFLVTYLGRMFLITAGYHRYFSHRSYRMARFPQFLMAFGCTMAAQKGPLWWAGNHRVHHRYADTENDLHSPMRGFWWSQVGWILCDKYGATRYDEIKDFAKYPELRFLNKYDWIGPWSLGVACFLIGGWSGLVVGFFASTILLWHTTFFVNSLAHVFGRRSYETNDTSRNSMLIALITGGEGWHNNHHRYPSSARQGFRWWQIDTTYYGLKVLQALGIVHDLRKPPARVLDEARRGRPLPGPSPSEPGGTFDGS